MTAGWLVVSSALPDELKPGDVFTIAAPPRRRTDRVSRILAWFGFARWEKEAREIRVIVAHD